MAKKNRPSVIIRRQSGGGHAAHHGGAWKIAYADFMTAMMAFFLVMWLLNATTDEQRLGIASYFNPLAEEKSAVPPTKPIDNPPAPSTSGSRFDRMDDDDPSDTSGPVPVPDSHHGSSSPIDSVPITHQYKHTTQHNAIASIVPVDEAVSGAYAENGSVGTRASATEQNALQNMAHNIADAVKSDPLLASQSGNLNVSYGRNEIRIELHDTDNVPMFDLGSSTPNKAGLAMLSEIAKWLAPMPERISIVGYTDAAPYKGKITSAMSNWTLSALRADKAREALVKSGYPDTRILDVSGGADRSLADEANPASAANRRVVIVMHRLYPLTDHPASSPQGPASPPQSATTEKPVAAQQDK
ncbi:MULTISPECIES: flagellar motor protein MotB [Asaia]|uniref:flagellar motor protein MotB n=1 Tax=Asaia TaxID=91914 RepID=UPI002FC2B57B